MPRLQFFIPCERVIIDKGTSAVSLISVLQTMVVQEPPSNIDPEAHGPARWSVVVNWQREAGDETRRFEQRLSLTDPAGRLRFTAKAEFEMTKQYHRSVAQIEGFPLRPAGEYRLELSIRDFGEKDWRVVTSYSLFLNYSTPSKSILSAQHPTR
jgi:hypothetical protein